MANKGSGSYWSDDPISRRSQDALGRVAYADRAADLIARSHTWESSVVFGLTGPWGSGKSSLVEMITESLLDNHEQWTVARFTPWATSDVTGLLAEFYAALSQALPPKRSESFRKAAGALAQVAAPAAKLIPYAGEALSAVVREGGERITESPPWQESFKKAADELKQLSVPVLVVADDVDRLQTGELLALLKVVRLLGRFPGVQYLLAYDEQTLFRSLQSASLVGIGNRAAERFMEKIVQYPLMVPPLLSHQLISRLESGITRTLADSGRQDIGTSRLSRVADVLQSQLSTPRAIDRFLAQLRHHLPMVDQEEIDDVDVILLTVLRVAFPTVYGELPRWRSVLLKGHTGEIKHGTHTLEYEPADWAPLVAPVPPDDRADAEELLVTLFPKLRSKGVISYSGDEPRRICHEDYFDRYFAIGIPAHDVSDAEVLAAVTAAAEGQGEGLRALLLSPDRSRAYLALSKAIRVNVPSTPAKRLELLRVLAGLADDLDHSAMRWFSASERAMVWMSEILLQLGSTVSAENVHDAIADASTLVQLRIWWTSSPRLDSLPESPSWTTAVNDRLTGAAIESFMANLLADDGASRDDPAGFYACFATARGGETKLLSRIESALKAGNISIAGLAARVVSTRTPMGVPDATSELSDFDNELWKVLAPDRNDPWYDLPIEASVDKDDVSWSNRRRYAQGRAKRPSPNNLAPETTKIEEVTDPSARG
jgi:hypothetical protein